MTIYQIFTFAPIVEQHAGSVTGRWPWRPPLSVDTSSARVSKIFIWGPALLLRRTWVFGAGIWDHAIWTVNLYGRVWFVEVGGPQRVAGTRTHRAMHQWGPSHTQGYTQVMHLLVHSQQWKSRNERRLRVTKGWVNPNEKYQKVCLHGCSWLQEKPLPSPSEFAKIWFEVQINVGKQQSLDSKHGCHLSERDLKASETTEKAHKEVILFTKGACCWKQTLFITEGMWVTWLIFNSGCNVCFQQVIIPKHLEYFCKMIITSENTEQYKIMSKMRHSKTSPWVQS